MQIYNSVTINIACNIQNKFVILKSYFKYFIDEFEINPIYSVFLEYYGGIIHVFFWSDNS